MSTVEKSLRLIRVAIQDCPADFVNWKYLREATTKHPINTTFLRVAQILSFFPSESQLLSHYVSIIAKHPDLKINERFLYFQIRRIHTYRQSSATKETSHDLIEVEKVASKMIQAISSFLLQVKDCNQEISLDVLAGYYMANQKTNGVFLESLEKYPNSSNLAFLYSRYLIECNADFMTGDQWYFKGEQMDSGIHVAKDYSFRSMVNLFPQYLKNNILDYRGKKVLHLKSAAESSSSAFSTSDRDELWEEYNEERAGRVVSKPKLRIALKRAVENISSRSLKSLGLSTIIKCILIIVASISIVVGGISVFDSRNNTSYLIYYSSQIFEKFNIGILAVTKMYGDKLNIIQNTSLIEPSLQLAQDDEVPIFDLLSDPHSIAISAVIDGFESLNTLGNILANIASTDEDLVKISTPFCIDGSVIYCNENGDLFSANNISQRGVLSYIFTQVLSASNLPSSGLDWYNHKSICEISSNAIITLQALFEQISEYIEFEDDSYESSASFLNNTTIYSPIIIFLILFIPFISFFLAYLGEIRDVFDLIILTPRGTFVESAEPIALKRNEKVDYSGSPSIESLSLPRVCFPFIIFIGSLAITAIFLVALLMLADYNQEYRNISNWISLSSKRLLFVIQTHSSVLLSSMFKKIGVTSYGSEELYLGFLLESINETLKTHRDLTINSDSHASINGYNDEIDSIHYGSSCTTNMSNMDIHSSYSCISTDMLILLLNKYASDMYIDIITANSDYILNSSTFFHFQHIILYHLLPNLQSIHNIIIQEMENLESSLQMSLLGYMLLALIISIMLYFLERFIIKFLSNSFNILRILMARIPPSHIISNQGLLDLIIGKTKSSRIQNLSSAHAVINSSPDAIFSLSPDLTIESMNPAATSTFGYTPEQLLGQTLTTIIPSNYSDDKKNVINSIVNSPDIDINGKLYRQAQLMKANQTAMTYSTRAIGKKDDGSEITLECSLLGIDKGSIFALIANDQTIVIKHQHLAEEAKKASEKLLNQILPPMIVQKMNAGEKEISFSVNSSTIIFIDIVKFSDYASLLTARQIMQNLGRIFMSFDDLVQKYPTILKIKLIGDVYMAAAGLFSPNISPETHASEVIKFAIESLHALEIANEALESSLTVRIGINTGGPLIAGVLGIDKPLFDIIGDPINVAARLQSTDIPNHIQISQTTYDLIKDKGFNAYERGKIFLKGKGEQMTYIIDPPEQSKIPQLFLPTQRITLPTKNITKAFVDSNDHNQSDVSIDSTSE